MLVVHVGLFIGIAANVSGDPKINLLAVHGIDNNWSAHILFSFQWKCLQKVYN